MAIKTDFDKEKIKEIKLWNKEKNRATDLF